MDDAKRSGQGFEHLVRILDTLRGPDGCPWDREQDERSIANYFLEEVFEAVDAILENDPAAVAEELGDVLMEVVFLTRIYKEKEHFTMSEVVDTINRKMKHRHPHVFGGKKLTDSAQVVNDWIRGKKLEKKRESLFDGIVRNAPALHAAYQIGLRASSFGFDWKDARDAFHKVKEEIGELEKAISEGDDDAVLQEMGDVFFAMANVSRLLGLNPEISLKKANDKFMKRFLRIEQKLREKGKSLEETDLEEMDAIWKQVKNSDT
ncbi:MAG: nucleoside triphosphate pyrophosphohydrolase [Candidatus Aminicenantes bacterium]|nr:nucleoside triphosphate pyrophosphohydrolase [Candidatus Aminicenantes bacterium]